MTIARALLGLVSLLGLAAESYAAPVTYNVTSGAVTNIQLDALTGSVQPCPIGGSVNCLSNGPLAIDFGVITLDEDMLILNNITLTASGTGSLALGGLYGLYQSADFSNTTFQSSSSSLLGGSGGNYSFNAPGSITTDLVMYMLGGPIALPAAVLPGAPSGSISVSGGLLDLHVQGILGFILDPLSPSQAAFVHADFQVQAQTPQAPVPEPSTALCLAFGLGILGVLVRCSSKQRKEVLGAP